MSEESTKIIKFPTSELKFGPELEGNGYLEMSALNALSSTGYTPTEEGVREYQRDFELEPTGIIDLETFGHLCYVLDTNDCQKVINELNDHLKLLAAKKKKDDRSPMEILWSYIILIFMIMAFILGIKDIFQFVVMIIRKFIFKV